MGKTDSERRAEVKVRQAASVARYVKAPVINNASGTGLAMHIHST